MMVVPIEMTKLEIEVRQDRSRAEQHVAIGFKRRREDQFRRIGQDVLIGLERVQHAPDDRKHPRQQEDQRDDHRRDEAEAFRRHFALRIANRTPEIRMVTISSATASAEP